MIEIINCLKLIHKAGYLYIDLKSNNIAVLCEKIKYRKNISNLILIDYGFCEKISNDKNKAPKEYGKKSYSSINALKGNPIIRKDDIIVLCYFILDLFSGSLPWDNIPSDKNKKEEIIKLKEKFSFKKFCGKDIKEVAFIFESANGLKFNETPDYDNYINLLQNYIKIKTGKEDTEILFDWEDKIIENIKYFGGIEAYLKDDKEISILFQGYPKFFIENFLGRYDK